MDLFNKKKLSEQESEITRLRDNILSLENEIDQLKDEKQREYKLHQDVVDTMLGEVRAFVVDNSHKDLNLRTVDTLLPMMRGIIETHKFTVMLGIWPPGIYPMKTQKLATEILIKFCQSITQIWFHNDLIEESIIDKVYTVHQNEAFVGCIVKISSKFDQDEFVYKVKKLPKSAYRFETDQILVKIRDIEVKKTTQTIELTYNYDFKGI